MYDYDTIHFGLRSFQIQEFNKEKFIEYLNNVEVRQKEDRDHYYTGFIGQNFRTTLTNNGITLKGSLYKYYKGYSLEPFELLEVKQAIEKLSDELHLDISKATATRLDFGRCYFNLQMPVYEYLKLLDPFGRYRKHEKYDSVYFELKTGIRSLVFYGKIEEMKSKPHAGLHITEKYRDQNILKYEIRFNKEIGRQLKGKGGEVFISDLTDEYFFNRVQDLYLSEYEKLKKHTVLVSEW